MVHIISSNLQVVFGFTGNLGKQIDPFAVDFFAAEFAILPHKLVESVVPDNATDEAKFVIDKELISFWFLVPLKSRF